MSGMERWRGNAYKVIGTVPADFFKRLESAIDVIDDPVLGLFEVTWGAGDKPLTQGMQFVAVQHTNDARAVSDRLKALFGVELDFAETKFFNFSFYNGGDNPLWNTSWDAFETDIPDTGDDIVDWDGVRLGVPPQPGPR